MKSPNNKFRIQKINFNEIRMGSPLFGEIQVEGSQLQLKDRIFGEAINFSQDSNFVALVELIGTKNGPDQNLIIFSLTTSKEFKLLNYKGLIKKVSWINSKQLLICTWSIHTGDQKRTIEFNSLAFQ